MQEVKDHVEREFQIPRSKQRVFADTTELTHVDYPARYVKPFSGTVLTVVLMTSFSEEVRAMPVDEQKRALEEKLLPSIREIDEERPDAIAQELLCLEVEAILQLFASEAELHKAICKARRVVKVRENYCSHR